MLLRPASPGTGVIAGGPVRAVLECAGIHDMLSKSLGSDNAINIVHATVAALKGLQRPEEVAARRGLPIEDVAPGRHAARPRAARAACRDGQLKVTQTRSHRSGQAQPARDPAVARSQAQIRQSVVRDDTPQIRGLIHTVRHLVTVEEVDWDDHQVHHLRPAPGPRPRRPAWSW